MDLTTLTGKGKATARYFKARESAVSASFSFIPPHIYLWRGGAVPAPVRAYLETGLLEEIDNPGSGFDCVLMTDAWFNPKPRPEPVKEKTLTVAEVCERLGVTREQFVRLRGQYGFPAPAEFIGGPSADRPDDTPRAAWYPSTVDAWLKGHPLMAASK